MPDIVPDDQVDWRRLLRHLPAFEVLGFEAGHWEGGAQEDGSLVMPWWSASDEVAAFEQDVYESGAVLSGFDWMSWQDDARRFMDSPETLGTADLPTCRRLLTTHVRADRFSEGHLAEMFESGHMVALLRRVADLARVPSDVDGAR